MLGEVGPGRLRTPLFLARLRAKCVLAGVEENIRPVDDQAARRVASLEDGVELLQQAGAEFFTFTLGVLEFCSDAAAAAAAAARLRSASA